MHYTDWNLLTSLSCIIVYLIAQRYFVQGIVLRGAEK